MLEIGDHDIPPGTVASIITHLEMRERAAPRPVPDPQGVTLERVHAPDAGWYRGLFDAVGGREWLWFSRLVMSDSDLERILGHDDVHVHAMRRAGQDIGLLELDFRVPGACLLVYFGLVPGAVGGGLGRWMMNRALAFAWVGGVEVFHVHTCTRDHPGALSFYRRSGFTPVRQQVEIAPDPRLSGALPMEAGPHVPVLKAR